jgi:zinc transport system permease protein
MTDFMELSFLQHALLAGILCSIASGIVGSYVVVRRITYIAAAIAHCVLGGLGISKYLSVVMGWTWLKPTYGAIASALISAFIIGFVSLRSKEREDTIISALWAFGMAIGVLCIFKTPGYNEDVMSYLFGNILLVSKEDLYLIGILDLIVLAITLIFYNQLLAVCFDEEFARTRGLPVEAYYILLLCIIALTVVLTISVVGIIMVIALLTLPVAISSRFFNQLWKIMISSVILGSIFTSGGLIFSYGPDLPSGALTIVLAGLTYFIVLIFESFTTKKTKISRGISHS